MAQHDYESTGFKERMKEFRTLFVFILLSAIISLVVMNILVFPLALFAVKGSSAFSLVVKIFILVVVITYSGFRIFQRVRQSREDGIPVGRAFALSFSRKGKSISSIFLVVLLSVLLIGILFFMMKYNYIILYELSQ
ncbi:MAG TPA: hypothetical protein VF857_03560 [Spirochaetota bacterium]